MRSINSFWLGPLSYFAVRVTLIFDHNYVSIIFSRLCKSYWRDSFKLLLLIFKALSWDTIVLPTWSLKMLNISFISARSLFNFIIYFFSASTLYIFARAVYNWLVFLLSLRWEFSSVNFWMIAYDSLSIFSIYSMPWLFYMYWHSKFLYLTSFYFIFCIKDVFSVSLSSN